MRIADGLYLSTSPDLLRRLLEPTPPPHARLIVGYSGWGPGQLEAELEASAWLMSDVDRDLIFNTPAERMWETRDPPPRRRSRDAADVAGSALTRTRAGGASCWLAGCVAASLRRGPRADRLSNRSRQIALVVARGYGLFSPGDVFDYQTTAWSDPGLAGYDELIDMTHVTEVSLPSAQRIQELASVAARMDVATVRSRFAIVAPTDLAYGLGRMFKVYREADERGSKEVDVFALSTKRCRSWA